MRRRDGRRRGQRRGRGEQRIEIHSRCNCHAARRSVPGRGSNLPPCRHDAALCSSTSDVKGPRGGPRPLSKPILHVMQSPILAALLGLAHFVRSGLLPHEDVLRRPEKSGSIESRPARLGVRIPCALYVFSVNSVIWRTAQMPRPRCGAKERERWRQRFRAAPGRSNGRRARCRPTVRRSGRERDPGRESWVPSPQSARQTRRAQAGHRGSTRSAVARNAARTPATRRDPHGR